jgi:hypothetical protein
MYVPKIKMSSCSTGCKWLCILAYIFAALGALVYCYNAMTKQGQAKPVRVPKVIQYLYLIGALVTLYCAIRWAVMKEPKIVKF